MSNKYVPGYGNNSPKLMIVGEAPGPDEELEGRPFVGKSGKLLDECLSLAGIHRDEVYITNVVKVRPPDNDIKRLGELGYKIEDFLPQLWNEINELNPNCILAVGGTALEHLTECKGILKYRGSILKASKSNHKVIPTIHPASLLHGKENTSSWRDFAFIKFDIKRAAKQSAFPEINLPIRNLHIANSYLDVVRFLERHTKHEYVSEDTETYKTIPICIGLSFDPSEAISIPLFHESISKHDQIEIWKTISEFNFDTRIKIIAQNAKFDEKRCRQVKLNWNNNLYFDTGMAWHCLFPEFPKKLEFISSICTEEPYYKDEGSEYDPRKHDFSRLLLYNAKDAAVTFECFIEINKLLSKNKLNNFFFEKVMPLHKLYSDIEDVGILVDYNTRNTLKNKYIILKETKHDQILDLISDGELAKKETYKHFNVMSNGPKNQVAKLVFQELMCPLRSDTSDETLKSLANNHFNKNNEKHKRIKSILLGILEERKLRKTIGTYLDAELISDISPFTGTNRIHTQCNINGTKSGRTSTSKLKPPVYYKLAGIALQTMTKHEDPNLDAPSADLRSMFIADEGYSFIEPDLSQAEDRVVCVLSEDWDALNEYEKTEFKYNKYGIKDDRHTQTAIDVCDLVFSEVTDYKRQIGKKTRHAGNYWMQKHTHMLQLASAGIFISEAEAGKQIERFHFHNPRIHNIFHRDIIECLKINNRILTTTHGRKRQFFDRWDDSLFREAYSYIPQAVVSDHLKFAMLRIKAKTGLQFLLESHDSFLALCKDELVQTVTKIIQEELEVPIDFRGCSLSRDYDLIIPCEIKIGKRWVDKSASYPDGMESKKKIKSNASKHLVADSSGFICRE